MTGVMIGAGYFARFQAQAWKRLPVEIVAVADAASEKARTFAKEFEFPHAYKSVEEMFERERPDFVDIATRPEPHLKLTSMVAARGAHVICQKPMAPTMDECNAMCEVCERAGVRLLIHENWRWQPWYREAKRILDSGQIGAMRRIEFDWRTGDGAGPKPYVTQPYFSSMPRLLIYETLVHILDTFRFLAGEFHVKGCETRRINPVIVAEDWAEIEVAFAAGATGKIRGDRVTGPVPAPVAMGSLLIEGEKGALKMAPDGHLFVTMRGEVERETDFAPTPLGYKGDSVFATQKHLIDCLRSGEPAESEGREYLKTVALVEECYQLAGMANLTL